MRVSAVSVGSKVEGSEGRGKQRHGESVLDGNLRLRRARGRTRAAAALRQRLRPPGGAREVVEWGSGAGVECGANGGLGVVL